MDEAVKELFNLYYKDVYSYLYSLCRDASLAEDLAAETFLEAVRSFVTFRGESDAKTWLFTLARRRWFAYLRKKKRQVQTETLSDFLPANTRNVDELCQDRALAGRVESLLAAEPERTRTVVHMRLAGYSFYEIGQKCGVSESSARVIDFRAKEKIRKKLKEEGLYEE